MSVLHLIVLAPPVYAEPEKATAPAIVSRTEARSGSGYRVTARDASGDPVVSVWDSSVSEARHVVERSAAKLASIANKRPDGVPFVRRLAS
ncbi:hypothetical protein [Myxococcus xanthus]|uniref:hypothetical protein n=1 Tax=Myxococcus xanthus TaxID=34 RepID=UPI00112D45DB|nr:hypothetical protein [Myxococcus xanthus]QDE83265.1 hypothetical protein BHS07_17835 [Myxococcus xanthus]